MTLQKMSSSVVGDQVLRELPSPGKSGSVFFVSYDERYMIKTMRKVRHGSQTAF